MSLRSRIPTFPGVLALALIGLPDVLHSSGLQLIRGPYLQSVTMTNVVVRWRTDVASSTLVNYGTNEANLDQETFDTVLVRNHVATLSGLKPGTRYFYAVGSLSETLAFGSEYTFVTAPATNKPVRVWAIGDCGTASAGDFGSHLVRDAYYRFAGERPTDVWLMLGDNAYGSGTDAQYQIAVFNTYQDLLRTTAVWPTIGNHETYGPAPNGRFAFLDIFSPPEDGQAGGIASGTPYFYSFDYAHIHFICLDSEVSSSEPGSDMLTWLEADLQATTKDWIVAYWHSPPYTKGSHDSDDRGDSGGRLFDMRERVVPILEAYGVDLVLCGHSHNYERSYLLRGHFGTSDSLLPSMILDPGSGREGDTGPYIKPTTGPRAGHGTVYIVAGSSGWATYATGFHPAMYTQLVERGSLILDFDGARCGAKFLRETGAIEDFFSILKGAPPAPFEIVQFQRFGSLAVLAWKSQPGVLYQIEAASRLHPPNWLPASTSIPSQGDTTFWSDTLPAYSGGAFLRVSEVSD